MKPYTVYITDSALTIHAKYFSLPRAMYLFLGLSSNLSMLTLHYALQYAVKTIAPQSA